MSQAKYPPFTRCDEKLTTCIQSLNRQANEIEALKKCCTQRGARLQILKEWMRLVDWHRFKYEYPDADDWFDEHGVPKR